MAKSKKPRKRYQNGVDDYQTMTQRALEQLDKHLRQRWADRVLGQDQDAPLPRPRPANPRNPRGLPVGIFIRNLRRKGYGQKEAIELAFQMAESRGRDWLAEIQGWLHTEGDVDVQPGDEIESSGEKLQK
jgi:hypothetical protein